MLLRALHEEGRLLVLNQLLRDLQLLILRGLGGVGVVLFFEEIAFVVGQRRVVREVLATFEVAGVRVDLCDESGLNTLVFEIVE